MKEACVVDSLFFEYPSKKILSGVHLELRPGEIVGILGRNGCGKTTLFNAVFGLIKESREVLKIDGNYIHKKDRWRSMAYQTQISSLPGDGRILPIVKRFLSGDQREFVYAHERIAGLGNPKIGSLSSGERRYLEFLLITALKRSISLLDEPFAQIEPLYIRFMFEVIQEAADAGRTILLTDHNHWDIRKVCTRLLVMKRGQLYPCPNSDEALREHGYI